MKRIKLFSILSLGLLGLAACGSGDASADGSERTIQLGHIVAESHPYHDGAEKFAELVEEYSEGNMTVEIFANNSLGTERELIEGLQIGSVDMGLTSTGTFSNFQPEIGVVDLPFLFRDEDHVDKVLQGEIGQELLASLDEVGIVGLSWWDNGFRHLTTNDKGVKKPEDLQGQKIRTLDNPVHNDIYQALGADPTPMAWPEVFSSLQNGAIDGQDNPVSGIHSHRLWEVQGHISLTGHMYSPALFSISKSLWEDLSESEQEIIARAADEAGQYEIDLNRNLIEEQLASLEENGMEIHEIDQEAFAEATRSVIEKYEDQFGKDLIEEIINTN